MLNNSKNLYKNFPKLFGFLFALGFAASAGAVSIDSDSRVSTLVYDENDVFTIHTQAGFQTDIELAPNESIDTISIGDSSGWQVTPATKRIFIKPIQKTGITNLSVITNHHTYQFELVATAPGSREGHAYVVKFYYPDQSNLAPNPVDRTRGSLRPIGSTPIPVLPGTIGVPQPPAPPPVQSQSQSSMPGTASYPPIPSGSMSAGNFNYNYLLTGPDSLAPTKIYDDGKSTFFEFKTLPNAQVTAIGLDGSQTPINGRPNGPTSIVVDKTAAQFLIKDNSGQTVTVYNQNMKLPPIPSARAQ